MNHSIRQLRRWLGTLLHRTAKHQRNSVRPGFEILEDRTLLSGSFPYVQSINRAVPATAITNATSVSYTVTFSEPVTGVNLSDFQLALGGNLSATLSQVTPVSTSVYTVTVTAITGNGALGLNLVDNGTIRDLNGHPLIQQNAPAAFQTAQFIVAGVEPFKAVLGDVNGDGKLDLVTANFASNSVSVLLGNGNGTFQNQLTFATGLRPQSLALADVNGDGKPDLIVTNSGSASVSVLLGNGNGTFQAQQTFATGPNPIGVAVGDVNGDGKPDLVIADFGAAEVSVLLGNGNGTFQPQQTFATESPTLSAALGDVNGDGNLDLVADNHSSGTVSVLLGNGNGTFQAQQTYATGVDPEQVVLSDLTADGKLDIAVPNFAGSSVSVLMGNGNGSFQPQTTFATGLYSTSLAVADLNGDGIPDLAVSNYGSANTSVLLGNGNGTFQIQQTFATQILPGSVVVGDLNGDGKPDLAFGNDGTGSNIVSALIANGNGTFQSVHSVTTDTYPFSVALGDVNGDGQPDIVTANYRGDTVSVLLGNGNATFQAQQTYATGNGPSSMAEADLTNDGDLDLVVTNFADSTVGVLLGNGNGTFQAQQTFAVGADPSAVAVADVNGDGTPDLIVANQNDGTVSVLLGNGNGTFQSQQTFAAGATPFSIAVADVNGDGIPDLVVANSYTNTLSVLLGNGNGTFQTQQTIAAGTYPISVVAADVNGDGIPDLVVANGKSNSLSVLLGNGNGTFQTQQTYPTGSFPIDVAVGDVNGDGKPDVVVADFHSSALSVLLGNGNGTFQAQQAFYTGAYPIALALGDVNGDGRPDIAVADLHSNTVNILLGNGAGNFTGQAFTISPPAVNHFTITAPATAAVGTSVNFTVTAQDLFYNTVSSYSGTIHFTSSDPGATLPADATLTNGTGVFSCVLQTAGSQTITATDAVDAVTGRTAPITVSGAATHFLVAAPASTAAGSPFVFTVTALDSLNDVATGYTGTVHLTSSDAQAALVSTSTFSGGVGFFAVVLKTAGSQTIGAVDSATSSITGSAQVSVTPAAVNHLTLTAPASASTGSPVSITVTALDPFGNIIPTYSGTIHFTSSDASAVLPGNSTLTNGTGIFSVTLKTTGSQTLTGADIGTSSISGTASIAAVGLTVTALTPTSTGFTATFSKPFLASMINLYDTSGTLGPDDVILVNAATPSKIIHGSLIIDPTDTTITFVKTSAFNGVNFNPGTGVLAVGTYSVTLRSASNGFTDALGELLEGGSNYAATFVVGATPPVAIGIPSFARGPNSAQTIELPNTASVGIPINLSTGAGVTSGSFTLQFNSAFLTVSAATVNSALSGATLTLAPSSTPGNAVLSFTSPTALASGVINLGGLQANVPNSAAAFYKSKALLHFAGIQFNGGAIAVTGDDAVEVVAYFGDTTGDGSLTSGGAALIARVATALDTNASAGTVGGFAAFPLADPAIIGNLSSTGNIDSSDVTLLNSVLAGIARSQLPSVPSGIVITPNGPDPTLSLGNDVPVHPGGTIVIPINIDTAHPVGSTGATEAILALEFNPQVFNVSAQDVQLGSLTASGWKLTTVVNSQTGAIGIDLFSATPIQTTAAGSLVTITMHVDRGPWTVDRGEMAGELLTPLALMNQVDPTTQRVFTTTVSDSQNAFVLHFAVANSYLESALGSQPMTGSDPAFGQKQGTTAFTRHSPLVTANLLEQVFGEFMPMLTQDSILAEPGVIVDRDSNDDTVAAAQDMPWLEPLGVLQGDIVPIAVLEAVAQAKHDALGGLDDDADL